MAAIIVSTSHVVAPVLPGRLVASLLTPSLSFLSRDAGPVTGEARGRVEIVAPEAGLIRVSSGFLGLMSVALLVTPETLIVVKDKEGGFGDIRQGERVVAAYEVRRGALEAKRVEMFSPSGVGN